MVAKIQDRNVVIGPVPSTPKRRATHAELADVALLDDAALRLGRSGKAAFEYFLHLDALRAVAEDLGHAALAERAARAELHTRVTLSAGVDALNELQDLGMLQDAVRAALKKPKIVNGTELPELVRRAASILSDRYPGQDWRWLTNATDQLADIRVHIKPIGERLDVTVTQGEQVTTMSIRPEDGLRVDVSAFFSEGSSQFIVGANPFFAPTAEEPDALSAYDTAIGGLAFAREWVYQHARNAAESGAPARAGGIAPLIIVVIVVAVMALVVGGIQYIICKVDNDESACTLSYILGLIGNILLGIAGGGEAKDGGTGSSGSKLSFGTNP
ncbi:hypothetical protein [Microvirga sp. G4-2]|uniref:hypothetical protein n=1 Tax=Microvirga sp. G4-2 TaxID=3434467 RepID=UPI004043D6E7